jgi:hypothetical protein
VDYDNLNLDVVTTPEPSYLLILATGLVGLVVLSRRNQSRV